eukprot:TRINITY_DN15277_c0_g2_i1.p1 TRINITY_DN15277_c0_g2~~TRINITY_DN15277_c0_g2_i1.p1  ORF type:complete len:201 (+),score=24.49 TRINITY_DN15277_c0_g2_i1:37-603(+)
MKFFPVWSTCFVGCVALTIHHPSPSAMKADLAELDTTHRKTEDVTHQADIAYKKSKALLTELKLFSQIPVAQVVADIGLAPRLLKSLKGNVTTLTKIVADMTTAHDHSSQLYQRLIQEDSQDSTNQLVKIMQNADDTNFKLHHRLAESFAFKFKRAAHMITKAEKDTDRKHGMSELLKSMQELMKYVG